MKITTGRGTIPIIVMIAIWSISAITSLPGLAISPILAEIDKIFPHAKELEIQMLSSIPSLLIIPFILLSGKLAENIDKNKLLIVGLLIFIVSGILYLFSSTMLQLILISCLLGIGAGIIIPLSTGLISDFFIGTYKTKQLGVSSAITNLSLVIATALTGKLALINWHYPFIVYLFPIITILLSYFLTDNKLESLDVSYIKEDTTESIQSKYLKQGQKINRPALIKVMLMYFFITYIVLVFTLNLPFLIQKYHLLSSDSGYIISLFFLAIMIPGFFINQTINILKDYTISLACLLVSIGLLLTIVFKSEWMIALSVIISGLGYGIIQPMVYDKATQLAIHKKVVLVMGFVMSMNYLAILLTPFIVDGIGELLNLKGYIYPFYINLILSIFLFALSFLRRKSFTFSSRIIG